MQNNKIIGNVKGTSGGPVGSWGAEDVTYAFWRCLCSDQIQVESCFCDKSTLYEIKEYVAFAVLTKNSIIQ